MRSNALRLPILIAVMTLGESVKAEPVFTEYNFILPPAGIPRDESGVNIDINGDRVADLIFWHLPAYGTGLSLGYSRNLAVGLNGAAVAFEGIANNYEKNPLTAAFLPGRLIGPDASWTASRTLISDIGSSARVDALLDDQVSLGV